MVMLSSGSNVFSEDNIPALKGMGKDGNLPIGIALSPEKLFNNANPLGCGRTGDEKKTACKAGLFGSQFQVLVVGSRG